MPDAWTSAELCDGRWAGPVLVRGLSGCGKTRLALQRAVFLVEGLGKRRVLFLVGSPGAAVRLARQIPEGLRDRIELSPMRSWIAARCRRLGLRYSPITEADRKRLWSVAMQSASSQLSLACCQAEWLQVQAWGIRELSDYLAMPSEGREEREKMQLWDVLTTYRAALDAEGLAGPDDYARMLSELLRDNPALRLHDAVVVDNVEDASLAELRLLRQLLAWQENDLFLLGEAAQRLHPAPAACRHAGIHLEQRHFELRRDWRCAQATHDWALRVLATCAFDDLDGGTRSELGVVGHEQGEGPQVQGFADFEEELAFVSELLERWLGELAADEIAVCCREPRTLRTVQRQLEGASVPVQVLDSAVESEQAAVCLASFAQVKGLEFERVIVVDAGTQSRPSQTGLATLCQERAELLERVALYVACTRARSQLVVTYHGQAAAWF